MFRNLTRKLFGNFSFGMLLLEFISIILAIFLGNLATDWNQNRNKQRETQEALRQMCDELTQNYNNLQPYQVYYQRMISLLDSLEAIGQFDAFFEHDEFRSINPPFVYTFAYEMAKVSSKFANIEHDRASTIYKNYASLEGLNSTIDQTQIRILAREIQGAQDWRTTFEFYREPIDIFFRDYPLLQQQCICAESCQ